MSAKIYVPCLQQFLSSAAILNLENITYIVCHQLTEITTEAPLPRNSTAGGRAESKRQDNA